MRRFAGTSMYTSIFDSIGTPSFCWIRILRTELGKKKTIKTGIKYLTQTHSQKKTIRKTIITTQLLNLWKTMYITIHIFIYVFLQNSIDWRYDIRYTSVSTPTGGSGEHSFVHAPLDPFSGIILRLSLVKVRPITGHLSLLETKTMFVEIFLTFHGAEDWSRINCSSAGAAGWVGGLET